MADSEQAQITVSTDEDGDMWATMTRNGVTVREKLPRYMRKAGPEWQEVTMREITKNLIRKLGIGEYKHPKRL